jgi:hypothetical protein
MRDLLIRELKTWVQYFLVTLIAATVAGWAMEDARVGETQAGTGQGDIAINLRQMELALWNNYYRWLIYTFVVLSIARLLIIFIIRRRATQI